MSKYIIILQKIEKLAKNCTRDFLLKNVEFNENFHTSIVHWKGGERKRGEKIHGFYRSLSGWMKDHLEVEIKSKEVKIIQKF